MRFFSYIFILTLSLFPYLSKAQIGHLIGTSDEFIMENVKGYSSVEERSIEHEEYNVLVFSEKESELSFYFTFYRGEKVCNYIRKVAPFKELKEDIDFIKSNLKQTQDNQWENPEKTIQVEINEVNGLGLILTRWIR